MAEPPDYAELAKRYVDLWQDHLTAIAGDPALAEGMARLFLGGATHTPFGGLNDAAVASAARAAAAAAPSHDRGNGLDELARRIAALEERIAALEAGTRRGNARPQKKSRRRRV